MLKNDRKDIKLTTTDKELLKEIGGEVRMIDVNPAAMQDDETRQALLRMMVRISKGEVKNPESER